MVREKLITLYTHKFTFTHTHKPLLFYCMCICTHMSLLMGNADLLSNKSRLSDSTRHSRWALWQEEREQLELQHHKTRVSFKYSSDFWKSIFAAFCSILCLFVSSFPTEGRNWNRVFTTQENTVRFAVWILSKSQRVDILFPLFLSLGLFVCASMLLCTHICQCTLPCV